MTSLLPRVAHAAPRLPGRSALRRHRAHPTRRGRRPVPRRARCTGACHPERQHADRFAKYRSVNAQRRVLVVLDDVTCGSRVAPLMPGSGGSRSWSAADTSSSAWNGRARPGSAHSTPWRALSCSRVSSAVIAPMRSPRPRVPACARLLLALRVVESRLTHRPNHRLDAVARRPADLRRVPSESSTNCASAAWPCARPGAARTTTRPAAAPTAPTGAPFCAALA